VQEELKLNDNNGASFDSFDFMFDDTEPYSNNVEEKEQRYIYICTCIHVYLNMSKYARV
jgi:hypothetical protein